MGMLGREEKYEHNYESIIKPSIILCPIHCTLLHKLLCSLSKKYTMRIIISVPSNKQRNWVMPQKIDNISGEDATRAWSLIFGQGCSSRSSVVKHVKICTQVLALLLGDVYGSSCSRACD